MPPHCGFTSENVRVGMLKEYVLEKKKINGKEELMGLLIEDTNLVGMSPKIQKKIGQEMSIVDYYEEKARRLMQREHHSSIFGFVERNFFREAFKIKKNDLKGKICYPLMFIMAHCRTI